MSWSDVFGWSAGTPWLVAVPVLGCVLWWRARARLREQLDLFGPVRAGALAAERSTRRERLRRTLHVVGLLAVVVAALGPRWGTIDATTEQRSVDVLICLDVSRSMLARDVVPTRLAGAQRDLRELADRAGGDRLGLVVFAGEARLTVPLTPDLATFAELVDLVDPRFVQKGGTDLGAALTTALTALEGASGEHEVVVLITDGEDHGGAGLRVAETCRDRNVTVHCVGVGSPRGSKIVLVDGDGAETFLVDRDGNDVVSAMDAAGLRRIAAATGGTFVTAVDVESPLRALYDREIRTMVRKAVAREQQRELRSRYQWPLAVGLLCWLLAFTLSERRPGGWA